MQHSDPIRARRRAFGALALDAVLVTAPSPGTPGCAAGQARSALGTGRAMSNFAALETPP